MCRAKHAPASRRPFCKNHELIDFELGPALEANSQCRTRTVTHESFYSDMTRSNNAISAYGVVTFGLWLASSS